MAEYALFERLEYETKDWPPDKRRESDALTFLLGIDIDHFGEPCLQGEPSERGDDDIVDDLNASGGSYSSPPAVVADLTNTDQHALHFLLGIGMSEEDELFTLNRRQVSIGLNGGVDTVACSHAEIPVPQLLDPHDRKAVLTDAVNSGSRIVVVTKAHHSPVCTFSVIGISKQRSAYSSQRDGTTKDEGGGAKVGEGMKLFLHMRRQYFKGRSWASFGEYLKPRQKQTGLPFPYRAFFLDDPELRAGKHRVVMNLAGYVTSVIPYTSKADLKDELNEQFKMKHEWLKNLTLSKIRSLKLDIVQVGLEAELEVSTIALAYIYFEKLVLQGAVTKANRRLLACACIVLATKFNDPKGVIGMDSVFDAIENHLETSRRELHLAELPVFIMLQFTLHVDLSEVMPHFAQLLRVMERTPQEYLGETTYALYFE
eukprot:Rmarinus@m.7403